MQELHTIGKEIHKGFCVKIYYTNDLNILDTYGKELFQILYIDEGAVVIGDDSDEKSLIAPVLLCLNYFEPQKTIHLKNANGYSVFFEPEAINHGLLESDSSSKNSSSEYLETEKLLMYPFKKSNKDNPVYLPVNGTVRERLLRIAQDMKDQFYTQPDDYWPCRGRSFFIEMLMLLQSLYKLQIDNSVQIQTNSKELVPIIKEIHLNYSNDSFNIKQLKTKDFLGKGIAYIKNCSTFKKQTGFTPSNYLENHRMQVAQNLLKDTVLQISEIARRCGYKSEAQFETIFEKNQKTSPSSYRASFPNPYG